MADKLIPYIKDKDGSLIAVAVIYDKDGNDITETYAKTASFDDGVVATDESITRYYNKTINIGVETASKTGYVKLFDYQLYSSWDSLTVSLDCMTKNGINLDAGTGYYNILIKRNTTSPYISNSTIKHLGGQMASAFYDNIWVVFDDSVGSYGQASVYWFDSSSSSYSYDFAILIKGISVRDINDSSISNFVLDTSNTYIDELPDTGYDPVNLTCTSYSTAATLVTSRTIQTNLASTSTASFDGSANITPGVTGTLPIANGGTGNTTGQAASVANSLTIGSTTYDGSSAVTIAKGSNITFTESDGTITISSSYTNTDTKVTNTASTTTKYYVTGTSSSSTNTGTQYFDTGVYVSATAGELVATKFTGALNGNASTATKATQDGSGNVITDTYVKKTDLSVSLYRDDEGYLCVEES